MNRTLKTLTGFLAVSVLLCGAFLTTGCETLEQSQKDHPIAWDIGKGAAETAIHLLIAGSDKSFIRDNRAALTFATNAVFARNDDPRDVALDLTRELQGIFPTDPNARDAIQRTIVAALTPPEGAPAAGTDPETQYKAALARHLDPDRQRMDPKWLRGINHMLNNS